MGTAPNEWQNPKTAWAATDVPLAPDFSRIETNVGAIETGSRTVDPAQAPNGNIGTLRQLLDWFANRIRAITGAVNWWDAPATTLAAAKNHFDATENAHPAAAISYDGAANLQAADVEGALDELGSEKVSRGGTNRAVELVMAFFMAADTRSWTATAWDATTTDLPTHIDIKDGADLVATVDFVYNASGKPTLMTVAAGGKTATYTVTYNNGTRFVSLTKAVV